MTVTGRDFARLHVPVGADADRWVTRTGCRRVLLVVHNVTSATRLLDILPLLQSDLRLQLFATCTGSSPFLAGVPELLAAAEIPVLPWGQAKETEFDLAVSASYGGELHAISGKLTVLSHGVGYNKKLETPKHRNTETPKHRNTETPKHRNTETPKHRNTETPVFGMAAEWLLHAGRPIATATVLSHPEQLDRLAAACPEAAATAVLAGDPCYDRILDALPHRDRFRRALGVAHGQRLLVVSSTWAPRSLFGDANDHDDLLPWLLDRLTADLPADEYRTVAVLHPNIWHGHGPGQIRSWLARARAAGLTLVPPLAGWRQALIAADCVLGDHSSVTFYAASIGAPVLLGAFPHADLDPGSPVAGLGRSAPMLRLDRSLRHQVDRAIADHDPRRYERLTAQTSSAPGDSARLLRQLFYDLIGIPEPPGHPARLDRLPLPSYAPPERTAPVHVLTRLVRTDPPEIAVTRYAGITFEPAGHDSPGASHLAVHEDTQDPAQLALADVIVQYADAADPRIGPADVWTAETLARHPYCGLAAYIDGPDRCVARTRDGRLVRLSAAPGADGRADLCDPAAYASALYAWCGSGRSPAGAAPGITVTTGAARHRVTVEPLPERSGQPD